MVALLNPIARTPNPALEELSLGHRPQGTELALLRARPALEAGWQFTAEEAVAYVGIDPLGSSNRIFSRSALAEYEDEAEELALYFSEN